MIYVWRVEQTFLSGGEFAFLLGMGVGVGLCVIFRVFCVCSGAMRNFSRSMSSFWMPMSSFCVLCACSSAMRNFHRSMSSFWMPMSSF